MSVSLVGLAECFHLYDINTICCSAVSKRALQRLYVSENEHRPIWLYVAKLFVPGGEFYYSETCMIPLVPHLFDSLTAAPSKNPCGLLEMFSGTGDFLWFSLFFTLLMLLSVCRRSKEESLLSL